MILIKQHDSHQAAHLYEHLFYMAIEDFFYGHDLSPYLDFEVTARTIHGIIYVHIKTFTDRAKQLESELLNIKISLASRRFHIGIIQLGSELRSQIGFAGDKTPDWDAVRGELLTIESKQWLNIDEVDVIDPRLVNLVYGSVYTLENKKELAPKKVKVTYAFNPKFAAEHKELLPLFTEITILMSENAQKKLCNRFGFYSDGVNFEPKNHATKLVRSFRNTEFALDTMKFELKDALQAVEDSIIDLYDADAFNRLADGLSQVKSTNRDIIFPNPYNIYKRTNVIIGAKGWQRIATDENCEKILSHMKVTISIGHSRASIDINSLLNADSNRSNGLML